MRAFLASDSALGLFDVQLGLAAEIQASETGQGDEEWYHRRRLRNIGDAVAWSVLTPHAIRNLLVPGRKTPSLTAQGPAFAHVLATGRSLLETGAFVVVSDLTNCIGTGDLVAIGDPNAPVLIECKLSVRSPEQQMQGRRGRQLSRDRAIASYLKNGRGFVPGVPGEKVAVEVRAEPKHHWDSIAVVIRDALANEMGVVMKDREAIWAVYQGAPKPAPDELAVFRGREILVGCHSALLSDDPPLVAPPLVWPIEPELVFALAECDIVLSHALEFSLFEGHGTSRFRLRGLRKLEAGIMGVVAEVDGRTLTLGPRFLANVVYGFETVESAAAHMLEAVERSLDVETVLASEPSPNERSSRKPKVHLIENRTDAERLLTGHRGREVADDDIVIFGPEFDRTLGVQGVPLRAGSVILVGKANKRDE